MKNQNSQTSRCKIQVTLNFKNVLCNLPKVSEGTPKHYFGGWQICQFASCDYHHD